MPGGPDVSVAEPTPEEREAQQIQLEILKQQRRESQLLAPFLFEGLGISPTIDPETGDIVGFEELEPTPAETMREEVEAGLLERTLAALSGDLPVDPALESNLEEGRRLLEEQLVQDFGSLGAARNSSAGAARLAEFDEFAENTRASARRGELSLAEQLAATEAGIRQNQQGLDFNQILTSTQRPFGQVPSSFGNFASSLASNRLRSSAIDAEIAANTINPIGAIAGTAAGIGLGAATGGAGSVLGSAFAKSLVS